jgi:gentisate 1,2-dioxygenase
VATARRKRRVTDAARPSVRLSTQLGAGDLVERAGAVNVRPLWTNALAHGANRRNPAPTLWRWSDIAPLIDEATAMTSTDVVERRVLSLVDPAYPENGTASTRNLNAGFQVLLPGERARPHRHSMNAIRFVVEGSGATTVVDGTPCPMNFGDLILTPGWTWHDHVHEGTERIVWLDVLDGQLHRFLETDAFEPGPIHDLEPPQAGQPPMFYYAWQSVVDALAATEAGEDRMRRVRYVNPVTGGAVMSMLDCALWEIGAGVSTRPTSSTAHHICAVVEGSGSTQAGDATIPWQPRDVFSLPAGQPVRHTAGDRARIFVVSDSEVLRRLDLLVERVLDDAS